MMWRGLALLWCVFLTGCAVLLDPNQTTTVSDYPAPQITAVRLFSSQIQLTITSQVVIVDPGLSYNIYVSTNPDDFQGAVFTVTNVNQFTSLSTKPRFVTNVPVTPDRFGFQNATVTLSNFVDGRVYYVAVSCFGSNSLLGTLRTNTGWIESPLSPLEKVATRPEMRFVLTNYFFSPMGIASALDFDVSNNLVITNAYSNSYSLVSNVFVAGAFQQSGLIYAGCVTGSAGSSSMQSLGVQDDFQLRNLIPSGGWVSRGTALPVAANYLFLVSNNIAHVKIYITNISAVPSSTSAQIVFSGIAAWQTNLGIKAL